MTPKRISLKNFLSFGDPGAVFEFEADEPLWVLCGPNGVGKSAVFDAITYALYGQHRGGVAKAEQLVRHGANGFEVEFDFEFDAVDYRIRRTRPRRGRTTQYLLKQVGGDWTHVRGNDPAGAVTADDIKGWVADTLGLGYEAFTNSVLLKQGEADKLFAASRDDRIAVLKGIIGFEDYEAVATRVQAAGAARRADADALLRRMDAASPVTDEELAAAETAAAEHAAARTAAHAARVAALLAVEQAKQWDGFEKRRADLAKKLAEAEERHKNGRRIRDDKRTLDDLTAAVPVLERLVGARARISCLEAEAEAAHATHAARTADRDAAASAVGQAGEMAAAYRTAAAAHQARAKELAGEIESAEKFLTEAEAVAELDARLQQFPPDLDTRVEAATAAEQVAARDERDAGTVKTLAKAAVGRVTADQKRFSGVGSVCSYCLQPVDEAHAAKERARLAGEFASAETDLTAADTAASEASARLTAAKVARAELTRTKDDRDTVATKHEARRSGLRALGITADPAELRGRLTTQRDERAAAERGARDEGALADTAAADAARCEKARKEHATAAAAADTAARTADTALAAARADETATRDRLTPEWQDRLPNLTAEAVAALAADRARLASSGVADEFVALAHDGARRAEWEAALAGVDREAEGVPAEARVPVADATGRHAAAQSAAEQADVAARAADDQRVKLAERKEQFAGLVRDHRAAAEQHRLHKKLYDLVGPNGLQRELVRDAEEQILGFANETLQHLSDGDLALEEEADEDSKKAFDLRVRRAGGEPIGVAFLSGSQRFRVAVSVALAVGRFASGRARPLESVIIDEGFGSLDRDGLRTMADELKRLQQASSLRRVVLVSHQEEFTDQFPVGYRLAPADGGTTAHPFRR